MSAPMKPDQGPEYPRELGATVAKYRRMAKSGLAALPAEDRAAYGDAVGEAIRAKQHAELMRAAPTARRPTCASGTAHNTGELIHHAVRAQQRAAVLGCPAAIRKARSDDALREQYEAAMKEKAEAREREIAASPNVVILKRRRTKGVAA